MAFEALKARRANRVPNESYADEVVIILWTLGSMAIGAGLLLAVQWFIRLVTKCHC